MSTLKDQVKFELVTLNSAQVHTLKILIANSILSHAVASKCHKISNETKNYLFNEVKHFESIRDTLNNSEQII